MLSGLALFSPFNRLSFNMFPALSHLRHRQPRAVSVRLNYDTENELDLIRVLVRYPAKSLTKKIKLLTKVMYEQFISTSHVQ